MSISAVLFSDVSFLLLSPQRPHQPMFWCKIWCDCMFTVKHCTRCVSTIKKWVRVAGCTLHGNQIKSKPDFFQPLNLSCAQYNIAYLKKKSGQLLTRSALKWWLSDSLTTYTVTMRNVCEANRREEACQCKGAMLCPCTLQ